MKCTRDHVLLSFSQKEEKQGNIIIPERSQKINNNCMVEMIGPDVKDVEVGDVVLRPDVSIIAHHKGQDCDIELDDGTKCILVKEDDIGLIVQERDEVDG